MRTACATECLSTGDLPFVLDVPERAGYNFAGWYTDSCYTEKITQIDASNARSMVLYAKWTAQIDNHYNVEMYSYSFTDRYSSRKKSLKDCNYNFREDVVIPGMPSTREQDYLADIISSDEQCLQGLCFTPELILMTAYAESQSDKGAMLVFDRETGDYLATLAMREDSHLAALPTTVRISGYVIPIPRRLSGFHMRISLKLPQKHRSAPWTCPL